MGPTPFPSGRPGFFVGGAHRPPIFSQGVGTLTSNVQDIEMMLTQYAREHGITLKDAFEEAMRRVREWEERNPGLIAFSE